MPCYKASQFIAQSIESVINQTHKNWELLITDDCSTDSSVEIIKSFTKKDPRIKLFVMEKNSGAAATRNNSLSFAQGNFIAFLDSDDMWLPQKLEKQLAFMQKNNCAISFTSYMPMSEDLNVKYKVINAVDKISYTQYLKNTIIGMSTSMIDKEKVGEFSFNNKLRTRQDAYLWISLLKKGNNACGLQEVLSIYRIRKNSISANKIKAAQKVWYLYYKLEKLGLLKSSYYFCFYALNAVKKRL